MQEVTLYSHSRGNVLCSIQCSFNQHNSKNRILDSLHQGLLYVQACAALEQAIGALEAGLLPQPMPPPAKLPGHCQRAMQDLEVRQKCFESVEKEKELSGRRLSAGSYRCTLIA